MHQDISKIYDPGKVEKKWQDFWEEKKIYKYDSESSKEIFSVDTPPPYISADSLHVGHAMSYTQAEIIIRYHRMLGKNIFYPMGFDDNGLPTERFVEKKYKVDKSKITRKDFVELCLKETSAGGKIYEKLWRQLGLSVDWSLLYSTISSLAQKIAQRSFIDLYRSKRAYQKEEPSFWCPHCQTALAQADLEDEEEKSFMYDIKFSFERKKEIIISTTRPELIPACVALYVNPQDKRYASYAGKYAFVPLTNDRVPIKTSSAVEMDKGTGFMMVCTWGDAEDITKWKEDGLDTKLIIEKNGRLNQKAGRYSGLNLIEARKEIVKDLEENNLIVGKNEISHVLNIHERCKHPVEFFVSRQWFIKILDLKKELKKRAGELIWRPEFMKARLDDWIDGLKWDWCISRDRFFGVPFPVWYCANCEEIIIPDDSELPVDPRENPPKNNICPRCAKQNLKGEKRVMDTWMTSSLTPLINSHWKDKEDITQKIYPMNLRVQAFEIIRTWLFYTLVKSHLHTNSLPWKTVMISGWGLAKDGEKMSKSLNNYVTVKSVIEKYGADALRFWSCGATLGMNLRWNEDDVRAGKKLLTKLWNASRFVMINLDDFDPSSKIELSRLEEADKWILAEFSQLIEKVTAEFEQYEFAKAKMHLERFFWIKFTDNYIELVKNRLYGNDSIKKQSAQFALYYVLSNLIKLFAPILPHITEELYHCFFKNSDKIDSIHLTSWPQAEKIYKNKDAEKQGLVLIEIISQVRKIKAEKKVKLYEDVEKISIEVSSAQLDFIEKCQKDLMALAHAKKIETIAGSNLSVKIKI